MHNYFDDASKKNLQGNSLVNEHKVLQADMQILKNASLSSPNNIIIDLNSWPKDFSILQFLHGYFDLTETKLGNSFSIAVFSKTPG